MYGVGEGQAMPQTRDQEESLCDLLHESLVETQTRCGGGSERGVAKLVKAPDTGGASDGRPPSLSAGSSPASPTIQAWSGSVICEFVLCKCGEQLSDTGTEMEFHHRDGCTRKTDGGMATYS